MQKHTLTESEAARYRADGYVVLPSLFTREEMNQVDNVIRQITRDAVASGDWSAVMELEPGSSTTDPVARRIYNPFERHQAFRGIASDSRILDRVEALIGSNISLHHSKLNMKPAKLGSAVEWHQDLAYFPHTNDDLVTTLVYLDDATEENGCLQVLPRHHSHFFDHCKKEDGIFAGQIVETVDDGRFGPPVALAAPAGSVIFMHCLTPHASLPNRSTKARRTLIFEYRAGDAYPIYFGPYITNLEKTSHMVRGKRSRTARFGGPTPLIPIMPENSEKKSLYALQEESGVSKLPQTAKA